MFLHIYTHLVPNMSRKTKKRKNPGGDNSDPPPKKQPVQSHSAVTHVDNATTGENSNVTPGTTGQKAEPAIVRKDLSVTSKMSNITMNEPTISEVNISPETGVGGGPKIPFLGHFWPFGARN